MYVCCVHHLYVLQVAHAEILVSRGQTLFCAGRYRLEISARVKRVWNSSQSWLGTDTTDLAVGDNCCHMTISASKNDVYLWLLLKTFVDYADWPQVCRMCYSVFKQSFPEQKKWKLLYGIRCELELQILKLEIARALKTVVILQPIYLLVCALSKGTIKKISIHSKLTAIIQQQQSVTTTSIRLLQFKPIKPITSVV